jgi:hypothetical protein
MSTPLSALSNLISSGIATIESTYAKHGATFPSIDDPFQPGPFDEDEALCKIDDHVIAAAAQLSHSSSQPRVLSQKALCWYVIMCAYGCLLIDKSSNKFHLPASLQVAVTANIPEILREAGPQVCIVYTGKLHLSCFLTVVPGSLHQGHRGQVWL